MAKTLLRFLDTDGNPLSDAIAVELYGPIENSPVDHSSILEPAAGNENGFRIFEDLPMGSYNLKFDEIVQANLSPMWISGPVTGFDPGVVDSTEIADSAIIESKIAADAVTADKIASAAITTSKLNTGCVTFHKLASDSITADKIVDQTISKVKLSADIFNAMMVDTGGWGPKIDGITLGTNTSSQLFVATDGIGATQLASNAVTEIKILNAAVSTSKLANEAVTGEKIQDNAISEAKIADDAVTSAKIKLGELLVAHFATGAITDLRAAANYIPTGTVYVSPNFAGAEAPYFDDLQAAIDYLEDVYTGNAGTVYIYPGIYLGSFIINKSISIIGIDKGRTILYNIPSTSDPNTLNLLGTSGENTLIQNVTIRSISNNIDAVNACGIFIDSIISQFVILDNINVYVKGRSHSTDAYGAIGLDVENSKLDITNSYFEVYGGNNTNEDGGFSYGVRLTNGCRIYFDNFRILGRPGTGGAPSQRGKGYGFYNNDTSSIIYGVKGVIDTFDHAIKSTSGVSEVTLVNTMMKVDVDEAEVPKTKFVQNAVSSYLTIPSLSEDV